MKRIIANIILLFLFINYINGFLIHWNKTYDEVIIDLYEDKYNWDPNVVPGSNDDAYLGNGGRIASQSNIVVSSIDIFWGDFLYLAAQLYSINYTEISIYGSFSLAYGGSIQTKLFKNEGTINCVHVDGNTQVFDCYIIHSRMVFNSLGDLLVSQNSKLSLYNDSIELYGWGSIESKNNSHVALMGAGIFMYDNSSIANYEGGTFYFNNTVYAQDQAYIRVLKSYIEIYNDMVFKGSSSLSIESSSYLKSNASMAVYDKSHFSVEDGSRAEFNGFIAFYNSSTLWVSNKSIVIVEDQLYGGYNTILSVWDGSYIYVKGSAVFGNVINTNANIIIEKTCFIDNILSNTNGNFIVYGVFTFNAYIGYFNSSNIINQGDFNLRGIIYATDTLIQIVEGNFNVYDGAFLWLFDCTVSVDGFISISNSSYLNIERTSFYVSEKGQMESKGNIYLSQNTDFNNVGTLNIHSGIYYTNDTSIKSKNVTVSNSGTFNVLEKIDINVGFNNSGNINLNNKELFVYDLNQVNGTIDLSGGTINSDNTLKINGGNVEGSGNIGNSIIQNNGTIGSKNKINNIIVNGNFKSSSSKVIFVVDSLESFSTLDILQDIEFSGEIEVRFSIQFLEQIKSGKYNINTRNNNINVNNLESSIGTSSSSDLNKINLINFNSNSNSNGFSSIKFKSYDPNNSNEDAKDYDGCNVKTSKSDKSFSLLFNEGDCGSSLTKKLSGGIIAAIVVCCALAIVIATVAFHYRERLRLLSKTSKVGTKLKSVRNSIRNSVSLKSTNPK